MMGPYSYWGTSYTEPTDLHEHDCMWSGECCCKNVVFWTPRTEGTVPITVGNSTSGGFITLAAGNRETPVQVRQVQFPTTTINMALDQSEETCSTSSMDLKVEPPSSPVTRAAIAAPADRPLRSLPSKHMATIRGSLRSGSLHNPKLNKANLHGVSKRQSGSSSSDNKKLRHREVEKNRHRMLQAMVKTLSDKIPGRMDKETQVQTMKRAARYLVYLRDVIGIHGPQRTREKLETIYLRASDTVESYEAFPMKTR